MDDEAAAEQYFKDWFQSCLQPRAAALGVPESGPITFEVMFPRDFDSEKLFYTQNDWTQSESIILRDDECEYNAIATRRHANNEHNQMGKHVPLCLVFWTIQLETRKTLGVGAVLMIRRHPDPARLSWNRRSRL